MPVFSFRIHACWLLCLIFPQQHKLFESAAAVMERLHMGCLAVSSSADGPHASMKGRPLPQATSVAERASARQPAAADFIRPHLRRLSAYTPIEPFEVLSARLGRKPEEIVKLDANENPYGPPQAVRDALAAMPFPHIYPDPETRRLRRALSGAIGVPVENLLVRPALASSDLRCLKGFVCTGAWSSVLTHADDWCILSAVVQLERLVCQHRHCAGGLWGG